MKPVKKLLALILAGIMALALLTGCGKAASLNRTIAEGLAEYAKSTFAQLGNENNISVSYQVPELSRNIAPLFDENWVTKDSSGKDALTEAAKETLTDILHIRFLRRLPCDGYHRCQKPGLGSLKFELLGYSFPPH